MKNSYLHIIPECYVDTNLVQILLQIKGVNHQYGCGQVTNVMQKHFKDSFSIGIVDNDDLQSNYSKACVAIASSDEITLCKHPNTHHYLIKINHVMERFILNCAEKQGIDLDANGIPSDLEGLKSITKSKECLDNPDLKRALKAVSKSNEMMLLTEVLEYLEAHKYDSKDADLKSIFSFHGFK